MAKFFIRPLNLSLLPLDSSTKGAKQAVNTNNQDETPKRPSSITKEDRIMEWGIIITGFYLVGMVGLMIGSINRDSGTQDQQSHSTEHDASMKKAA